MNNKEYEAKLREHFKVGNVVESYGPQPDIVIDLAINKDIPRGWEVWVREIKEDGSLGRLRAHYTDPTNDKILFENN